MNLPSRGEHGRLDFEEIGELGNTAVADPNDPRRERDLVDQFLMGTLSSSGEDEFRGFSLSHILDLRRSVGATGWSSRGSNNELMTCPEFQMGNRRDYMYDRRILP